MLISEELYFALKDGALSVKTHAAFKELIQYLKADLSEYRLEILSADHAVLHVGYLRYEYKNGDFV